jgi:signal transduction histidine kinase
LHKAITSSESQQELLAYHNTWSNLKLDFSGALKELEGLSGNIQYEQLDYLGLEYSLDRLVATFHTKLPSGFSGTLCTAGSAEYVTFWSDWDDNCT